MIHGKIIDDDVRKEGEDHETRFWQDFVSTERFERNWLKAHPNPELDIEVDLLIKAIAAGRSADNPVNVLDVGSGPVSMMTNSFHNLPVSLHAADPLADKYDKLWSHPLKDKVCKPVKALGEELSKVFTRDTFDVVHIRNAIDHCLHPIKVCEEFYKVSKNGALIIIHGWEDEAVHQQFEGMHQWSMRLTDHGEVSFVGPRDQTFALLDHFSGRMKNLKTWKKKKPPKKKVWIGALLQVIK